MLHEVPSTEIWSLTSSIVSVILGLGAIALSVYFFVAGKKTETAVSVSLTKIETQADMLQKLASRQLDRLTRYVTEDRPGSGAESFARQVLETFSNLPLTLIAQFQQTSQAGDREQLLDELLLCYIVLAFYAAQSNYWAQWWLPSPGDFDENNYFHALSRRIVDMSAQDFTTVLARIDNYEPVRLARNPQRQLLDETKTLWAPQVKTSATLFVEKEKAKNQ